MKRILGTTVLILVMGAMVCLAGCGSEAEAEMNAEAEKVDKGLEGMPPVPEDSGRAMGGEEGAPSIKGGARGGN
jgi:hypothetical protein